MEKLLSLLLVYKYHLLIPLAIIEGPIVTVLGGFFVTLKIFNPWLVYGIIIMGDLIGDTFYYALGRFGGRALVKRFGHHFQITKAKMEKAKSHFDKHHNKTIVLAKLMQGVGFTGLIVAGSLKISFPRYLRICFLTTLIQATVWLIVGILFGHAYLQLNRYLDYFSAVTITLGLVVILLLLARKIKLKPKK